MKLPTVTQLAKGTAVFDKYYDQSLWYTIVYDDADLMPDGVGFFEVQVPLVDAGGGEFLREMKGLNLMRWARKNLEYLQKSQENESQT